MHAFPDRFFDRVICSRTVQELTDPRPSSWPPSVGRPLRGFAITGNWKNRAARLFSRSQARNPRLYDRVYESRPANPVTIITLKVLARQEFPSLPRASSAEIWHTPARSRPNPAATRCTIDQRGSLLAGDER